MKKMLTMARIMFLPVLLFLAACGGGGGEGGGGAGGVTVSGVAAAGAPLVGSVTIKDSSSPAKTKSATIVGDGSFSIDVSGLTPPFIIMATGTVGSTVHTLHSFANGAGTANVNPFANLAVALASGGLDPATIYAAPSAGVMQTISSKLPVTITDIQTKLGGLLALYDAAKIDPFLSNFIANHTGLDEVLDMVSIDLTSGVITIRNKTTNAVVFTAPVNNFAGGILDASKIPTPQIRAVISPIFTTVSLSKSVNFTADVLRSTNKSVTWSVVESSGGTITNAGVYTAPATEGTYHVKATSVANPSMPAIAIVKVIPLNVIVDVIPASATVASGGSKSFSASVTGTSNTAVTWSVVETGGGSITTSGVYTAIPLLPLPAPTMSRPPACPTRSRATRQRSSSLRQASPSTQQPPACQQAAASPSPLQ
ncbi:MAG: hypothetical protein JJE30_11180 [Desulfuromonadales bacterium]|nr:hypothetical protein [Desulfuromonadales bacterium]